MCIFYLNLINYIIHIHVLHECVYVYYVHACLWRPMEGTGSPGTAVINGCQAP